MGRAAGQCSCNTESKGKAWHKVKPEKRQGPDSEGQGCTLRVFSDDCSFENVFLATKWRTSSKAPGQMRRVY